MFSKYIAQNPENTKRLLGIDYESFQDLVQQAELKHLEAQSKKNTLIAKGGGRKSILSIPEQILLTLIYLRHHTTFHFLGICSGVSESTVHNIFHYWIEILQSFLPHSLLEQFKAEEEMYRELLEDLQEVELLVDSTEQPRQRPTQKEEREKFYSGYKHQHTVKNFL